MKDWRADISEVSSLYDVDMIEMMIFLRHQYLSAAKNMVRHPDCNGLGESEECIGAAMSLDLAIENALGKKIFHEVYC